LVAQIWGGKSGPVQQASDGGGGRAVAAGDVAFEFKVAAEQLAEFKRSQPLFPAGTIVIP
jgi:hypothetical protein